MTHNDYQEAGLTPEEIALMPQYVEGLLEFYESPAFEKLFEYYAFETGEMPYGIAKARTGDPDGWILDHLVDIGLEPWQDHWLENHARLVEEG